MLYTTTVELTQDHKEFLAAREADLLYYKDSRGASKKEDLLVGMLAELGAYNYLKSLGYSVTEPSFSYNKHVKTYDADIIGYINKEDDVLLKFHVKGQSLKSSNRHHHSWLFQRNDRLVKVQEIIDDTEYFIGCSVDTENFIVSILIDIPVKYIKYGECNYEPSRLTKVAVYLEDQHGI